VASEKQSKLLKINIIITIFNIIWNILLIPKYSFIWAWITTLLSQILLCIMWYYYTNKLVSIKLPWFFIFRVILVWTLFFLFWKYLINNFSISLYFDFFVYSISLSVLFFLYYFLEYRFLENKKI
jgi:O-antigen/teichoic acid export membrane protein